MSRQSPVPYRYKYERLARTRKPIHWAIETHTEYVSRKMELERLDAFLYTVETYLMKGWPPNARLHEMCREMGFTARMNLQALHEDILAAQEPYMRRPI